MQNSHKKKVLITGAAGFIGASLSLKFLKEGHTVCGIDEINNYYDIALKKARLNLINDFSVKSNRKWEFNKFSIKNEEMLFKTFSLFNPEIVINLAAQAGVRYSIQNPNSYIQSNIVGFLNILEACRKFPIQHLIYASSSSVYGGNSELPFKESQNVDHPVSLYAATKKSNELMAYSYSHLYDIPATGLRLFTVYGPWGRPDMAPMIFAKAACKGEKIKIFNYGRMKRDFTYVSEVVESIYKCCFKIPFKESVIEKDLPKKLVTLAPHKVFNVGNSNTIDIMDFIDLLEKELGLKSIKEFIQMQPGDVKATESDSTKLYEWIGFRPKISIEEGIPYFVKWFKEYYKIT